MFINKNKLTRSFVLVMLVSLLLFCIPSFFSEALDLAKLNAAIAGTLSYLLTWVAHFLTWVVIYAAGILDAILNGGVFAMGEDLIDLGWSLMRDVLNMGFILIMLAIAFGTIFKVQAYSVKTLLPKLLLAIILVNFSKAICYAVVDFGEILMNSVGTSLDKDGVGEAKAFSDWAKKVGYTKSDSGGFEQFTQSYRPPNIQGPMTAIVYAMGIHHLDASIGTVGLNINRNKADPGEDQSHYDYFNSWEWNLQLSMILFFLIFFVLIVCGLMIIFLIRKVYIWILIIFSPYVFWTSTVPFLRSALSKWWRQFGGYVFYGPVAFFMMYLSARFLTMHALGFANESKYNSTDYAKSAYTFFKNYPIGNLTGEDLFATLIVCVFLSFAVTFGKKMGVAGAGFVEGMGKKIQGNISKRLKSGAKGALKSTKGAAGYVAGRTYKAAKRVAWGLADKYTFTKNTRGGADRKAEKAKQAAEYQKVDENRPSDSLAYELSQMRSGPNLPLQPGGITRKQRSKVASLFNTLAKRGELDKAIVTDSNGNRTLFGHDIDTKEGVDKFMKFADFIGADSKSIMNAMPELAAAGISRGKPNERISAIKEKTKKAEGKKISKSSLNDYAVASALSLNQIRDINKNGSVDQQEALISGMGKAFDSVKGGAIEGDQANVVMRNAKNLALDNMKARGEHTKGIEKNIDNWDVKFENGNFVLKEKPSAQNRNTGGNNRSNQSGYGVA